MTNKERASKAAKVRNKIASEIAREKYYSNPSICKECNNIIHPTIRGNKTCWSEARVKKFCNHTCSAKYNNRNREFDPKFVEERNIRLQNLKNNKSKYQYNKCSCGNVKKIKAIKCSDCTRLNSVGNRTYKFYKDRYKDWWSARVPISKNARKVYNSSDKPKICYSCGYDKHYQVCHIKAVSEFDEDTLIKEINDLDNLVALCPNCHWELDHGLLKLEGICRIV